MNKLSIISRILVAFASGALVAVYFLPAWRIDLFAPQYPEGLAMFIWINNITGDVEIINGLNHYIGMKHITVDMFPEFKFLPYVVAVFMILGVSVAITGSRKLLAVYLGLTVLGGVAALYDFYRWGYDYGHNLDPNAPIQVPGLSYQPPIIGHKQLLNFDAYSYPAVAGWIVIGAGALAFGVWALEWLKARKSKRSGSVLAIAAIFCLSLASCNPGPEPIQYGKDMCSDCKMGIADSKFGAEVVTKKGKIYKFDDVNCMISFLNKDEVKPEDVKLKLVTAYETGELVDVNNLVFLMQDDIRSPMNSSTAAFPTTEAAEKMKTTGTIMDWDQLSQTMGK